MSNYNVPEWQMRTELLLGWEALEVLSLSTVAVIGLGGVGAYAAEMLARAGVGNLIILDSDTVNSTNKNRQLLALDSTLGLAKTDVMELRLRDINPKIGITVIREYINESNIYSVLDGLSPNCIVDAIDTLSPKIALIQYALASNIPIVSSMGAGAKRDATKVTVKDISKSYNCPLAYMLRKRLRKLGIKSGFKVVFSEELPDSDAFVPVEELNKKSMVGTISYMPAVFGIVAAQTALDMLLTKRDS